MNLPLILFIIVITSLILYIKNYLFVISIETIWLAKIFSFLLMSILSYGDNLKSYFIYLILVAFMLLLLISIYVDNKFIFMFIYKNFLRKIFYFSWTALAAILFIYLSFKIFDLIGQDIDISSYELGDCYQLHWQCLDFLSNKLLLFDYSSHDTIIKLPVRNLGVYFDPLVNLCNTNEPSTENTSGIVGNSVGDVSTVNETNTSSVMDNNHNTQSENSSGSRQKPKIAISTDYFPTEYIKSINPDADIEGLKAEKERMDTIGHCRHVDTAEFRAKPGEIVPPCDGNNMDPSEDLRKQLYMPEKHDAVKEDSDDVATICNDCQAIFCSDCREPGPILEDGSEDESEDE